MEYKYKVYVCDINGQVKKSIIIIGAGLGIGAAVAEKFGLEKFKVWLISRTAKNGQKLIKKLSEPGVTAFFEVGYASNLAELQQALLKLSAKLGEVDVLVYNAAALKSKDILLESGEQLTKDFCNNVAAALESTKALFTNLKKSRGIILIIGGGLATHPHPQYGSLSIGKAGLRSLALQLHERLKDDLIYVGLLTITQSVTPSNPVYSPAAIAEQFWKLQVEKTQAELIL